MTIEYFAAQRCRRALVPGRFRMLLPLMVGLAGGSAYAVVVQQGQALRLPLSKDGYNWLSAQLDSPLSNNASVLVTAKSATGETVTARFVAK